MAPRAAFQLQIQTAAFTASFPVGTRVRLHGLAAANRFNGKHGVIIKRTRPIAPGRGAVRIDGEAKGMSVCLANMEEDDAGTGSLIHLPTRSIQPPPVVPTIQLPLRQQWHGTHPEVATETTPTMTTIKLEERWDFNEDFTPAPPQDYDTENAAPFAFPLWAVAAQVAATDARGGPGHLVVTPQATSDSGCPGRVCAASGTETGTGGDKHDVSSAPAASAIKGRDSLRRSTVPKLQQLKLEQDAEPELSKSKGKRRAPKKAKSKSSPGPRGAQARASAPWRTAHDYEYSPRSATPLYPKQGDAIDRKLKSIFPDKILALSPSRFKSWVQDHTNGAKSKLTVGESKRLGVYRRKMLARVYAEASRKRRLDTCDETSSEIAQLRLENEGLKERVATLVATLLSAGSRT